MICCLDVNLRVEYVGDRDENIVVDDEGVVVLMIDCGDDELIVVMMFDGDGIVGGCDRLTLSSCIWCR